MAFRYYRTIRFHETDAAGVVYFANVLTLCHEAYEAALQTAPIDPKRFFSAQNEYPVPIVHAQADYFMPMFAGDAIAITLMPKQLSPHSYEVRYTLDYQQPGPSLKPAESERPLATALTQHVCISKATRRKHPIDDRLTDWLIELAAPVVPND